MDETAGMLAARLALIDRVRRIEHVLARGEQARIATQMMKGFSHELGNQVQIVKLSALELGRRLDGHDGIGELVKDMSQAADIATNVLMEMFSVTRGPDRDVVGPAVAQCVRAAVDVVRPAIRAQIELRIDLADTVQTYAAGDELEALVFAALLDAGSAAHVNVLVRERTIQGKRWVELLRLDDRHHLADGDLAGMFEPHSLLHVVAGVAKLAGGEASVAPGRGGLELAVELPVAPSRG